jgi:hypothetical protein
MIAIAVMLIWFALLQCSCAIQCAVAIKTTVDIEHICDAFSAWNGSWVQGFD